MKLMMNCDAVHDLFGHGLRITIGIRGWSNASIEQIHILSLHISSFHRTCAEV